MQRASSAEHYINCICANGNSPDAFSAQRRAGRRIETLGGSTARLVLTVDDPDAVFERAVAAGAVVVWPVADRYGWRLGRVVDPLGHHWEIGKPLASEQQSA
jgi:uncharacterized glyoxalase superfamily protein PhnB